MKLSREREREQSEQRTNQFDGDVGARQQRTDCIALGHVAGHLQDGHAHVAADAERDAETETAEQCQLEACTARAARTAAAPTSQARSVHGAWTAADSASSRLVGLIQVVILIRSLLFLTDAAR